MKHALWDWNLQMLKRKNVKWTGEYFVVYEKINEIDTTNVKPAEHVMPIANVLREDNAGNSYEVEYITILAKYLPDWWI